MCAICDLTSIPTCAIGSVCGASLKESLGMVAMLGAGGVGTFRIWFMDKTNKNEKKHGTKHK